jgi:Arc/MetJ-type ribon-helix-helix transcriptional regulator
MPKKEFRGWTLRNRVHVEGQSLRPVFALPRSKFSLTLKGDEERSKHEERTTVTIRLTPEQERRLQAVMSRGAYESVEEVVDAALAAVERRILPGFAGTPDELDALLAEGLASKELTVTDFWDSVNKRTDILLAERKTGLRP